MSDRTQSYDAARLATPITVISPTGDGDYTTTYGEYRAAEADRQSWNQLQAQWAAEDRRRLVRNALADAAFVALTALVVVTLSLAWTALVG